MTCSWKLREIKPLQTGSSSSKRSFEASKTGVLQNHFFMVFIPFGSRKMFRSWIFISKIPVKTNDNACEIRNEITHTGSMDHFDKLSTHNRSSLKVFKWTWHLREVFYFSFCSDWILARHQINLPEDEEVGCVDPEDVERVSVQEELWSCKSHLCFSKIFVLDHQ